MERVYGAIGEKDYRAVVRRWPGKREEAEFEGGMVFTEFTADLSLMRMEHAVCRLGTRRMSYDDGSVEESSFRWEARSPLDFIPVGCGLESYERPGEPKEVCFQKYGRNGSCFSSFLKLPIGSPSLFYQAHLGWNESQAKVEAECVAAGEEAKRVAGLAHEQFGLHLTWKQVCAAADARSRDVLR